MYVFPMHTLKNTIQILALLLTSAGISLAQNTTNTSVIQTNSDQCVGIYNSRAVALAWGRSKAHNDVITQLYAEAQKAKATGDSAKLKELRKQGSSMQDKLHRQVFGDAPIDDILSTALKDALPAIMKKAGVTQIAAKTPNNSTVKTVDITEALVDYFNPTPQTRKMISDLVKHPPLSQDKFPLKD